MAKTKTKSKKINLKQILNFKFLVILLILGVALGNFIFIQSYVIDSFGQEVTTVNMRSLLVRSMRSINKEMPFGASEEKQYLPEMNLAFPYSSNTHLEYQYQTESTDGYAHSGYAYVTSTELVERGLDLLYSTINLEDLFNALPDAQKCTRTFLVFDKKDAKYMEANDLSWSDDNVGGVKPIPAGSFSTTDGRELAVYMEGVLCVHQDDPMVKDATATVLKGNSY